MHMIIRPWRLELDKCTGLTQAFDKPVISIYMGNSVHLCTFYHAHTHTPIPKGVHSHMEKTTMLQWCSMVVTRLYESMIVTRL